MYQNTNKSKNRFNKKKNKRKTQRHKPGKKENKLIKHKKVNKNTLNILLKQNNKTLKNNKFKNNKTEKLYQDAGATFDVLKKGLSQLKGQQLSSQNYLQQYLNSVNQLNDPKFIQSINKKPNNLVQAFDNIDDSLTLLTSNLNLDKNLTTQDEFTIREDLIRSLNTIEDTLNKFVKSNKELLSGPTRVKTNVFGKEVTSPNEYFIAMNEAKSLLENKIKYKVRNEATKLAQLQSQPNVVPNIKKITTGIELSLGSDIDTLQTQYQELLIAFNRFTKLYNQRTLDQWQEIFSIQNSSNPQLLSLKNNFQSLLTTLSTTHTKFFTSVDNISRQLLRFENINQDENKQYKPAGLDTIVQILNNYNKTFAPFIKDISRIQNVNYQFNRAAGLLLLLIIKQYNQIDFNLNQLENIQKKADESIKEAQAQLQQPVQSVEQSSLLAPVAVSSQVSEQPQSQEKGMFDITEESPEEIAAKEQKLKEATIISQPYLQKEVKRQRALDLLKQRTLAPPSIRANAVMSEPVPEGLPEPLQAEPIIAQPLSESLPEGLPQPLQPQVSSQPEPEVQVQPEPEPEPQVQTQPEPEPQPQVKPEPQPQSQVEPAAGVFQMLQEEQQQPTSVVSEDEKLQQKQELAKDVLAPMREQLLKNQRIIERAQAQQEQESLTPSLSEGQEPKELLPGEQEDERSKLLVTPKQPTFLSKMLEKRKQQQLEKDKSVVSTDYQPLVETAEPLPEPKPLTAAERGLIPEGDDFEKDILAQKVTLPPKSKPQTFIPQPAERPRGFPMQLPPSSVVRATPPTQDLTELPIPDSSSMPQAMSVQAETPYGTPIVTGQPVMSFVNKLEGLRNEIQKQKQDINRDKQQMEEVNLIASHYKQCNTYVSKYISDLNNLSQESVLIENKLQQPNLTDIEINNINNEKTDLLNKFTTIQSEFDENLMKCSSVSAATGEEGQETEEEFDEELQQLIRKRQQIIGEPLSSEEQEKLKDLLQIPESSLPKLEDIQQQQEPPLKSVITSVSSSPTDDGASKVTITVKVPRVYPTQLTGSISGTAAELFQQMMNQPYRNIESTTTPIQTKTTIVNQDGSIGSEITKEPEVGSLIDLSIPSEQETKLPEPEQAIPVEASQESNIQETNITSTEPSSLPQESIIPQAESNISLTDEEQKQKYKRQAFQSYIQSNKPFGKRQEDDSETMTTLSRADSELPKEVSGQPVVTATSEASSLVPSESSTSKKKPRQRKVTFEKTDMPVRQTRTRTVRAPEILNKGGNSQILEEVNLTENHSEGSDYIKNLLQTISTKPIKKQRTPKKYKKINKKDLKNITLKNN